MTTRKILFRPNDGPQTAFLASTCREVLYGGAVAGGKSAALIMQPLRWVDHPQFRGIILRRHRRDLQELIDRTRDIYPQVIGSTGEWNETETRWKFPAGGFLQMGFCDRERDIERYKSFEYCFIGFDELCLHPDTEVLTKSGWKQIENIRIGEQVVSLQKSWKASYSPVTMTTSMNFSGKLRTTNSTTLDFAVTPRHSLVIEGQVNNTWRFCKAEELPKYPHFPFHHSWQAPGLPSIVEFPKPKGRGHGRNSNSIDKLLTTDWLEFLGWFLSEGSAFLTHSSPCVAISQTKNQPSLTALMNRLPWRVKYTEGEGFRIFSRQLFDLLKPLGNVYEKRIPREILENASAEQLEILFNSFALGDGFTTESGLISFTLANEGLVDDLQEIAAKLGRRANKRQVFNYLKKYDRKYVGWKLSVYSKNASKRAIESYSHKSWTPYEGKVYCITVEPNHTFLCRYNGKMFWSGNTEFPEYPYVFMFTRNRSKSADLPTYLRACTNPGGEGMAWVDQRFLGTRPDGTQVFRPYQVYKHSQYVEGLGDLTITRQYIPSTVFDNPRLPNRAEYIAGLAHLPDDEREAMLYGRWGRFRGQYFKKAPKEVEPKIKEPGWFVIRCMDYGWADPTCVLWLIVYPSGFVDVAAELYSPQLTSESVAHMITSVESDLKLGGRVRHSVLSPDAFRAGQEGEPSIAHNLNLAGIWFVPANNDRISGWHQIARLIAQDRLRVWRGRCPNLMRTLVKLPHEPNDPRDVKRRGIEDHAPEALRYGCMALIDEPEVEPRVEEAMSQNRDPYWESLQKHLANKDDGFLEGLGYGW